MIKIIMIAIYCLLLTTYCFSQVDSTYIKTLEKDYDVFSERLNNNLKEQEQLKGILYYIEEKYREEKKRVDTLKVKSGGDKN